MTSRYKMLKCIKQTVKSTTIKYQYNLWRIQVLKKYYKHLSSSPTGCEKKKDTEKMKQFMEYKDCKCIETKDNSLYRILERTAPVAFQFSMCTIENVMNLYEEQRNDWSIRKVSFVFCILYILLHVNRLSVVFAWAFFLATRLTTVSLDSIIT